MKTLKYIFPILKIKEPVILVGNSPSIKNNNNGKLIDKFKTIIRINDFKIKGFEKFVGKKTHIIVVNNSIYEKYKKSNKKIIVLDNSYKIDPNTFKKKLNHHVIDHNAALFLRYKYGPFKNLLRTLNCSGTWLNLLYPKNLTTGTILILLLLENKINFKFLGIDLNYKNDVPQYFNKKEFNKIDGHSHNFFLEKKVLNQLIKDKKIFSL